MVKFGKYRWHKMVSMGVMACRRIAKWKSVYTPKILKETGVFNGVEFVGIYPIIEFYILKNDFCIKGQNDNCVNHNLKKWLNERTV